MLEGRWGGKNTVKIYLCVYEYQCSLDNIAENVCENIRLYPMTDNDLSELWTIGRKEISEKKIKSLSKRIKDSGHFIYVIVWKTLKVGWVCMSIKPTYESGIRKKIFLENHEIYFYDDYILKEFRGNGIHKETIKLRKNKAYNMGYDTAKVVIYHNHYASEKNYTYNDFLLKTKMYAFRPFKLVIKKNVNSY